MCCRCDSETEKVSYGKVKVIVFSFVKTTSN